VKVVVALLLLLVPAVAHAQDAATPPGVVDLTTRPKPRDSGRHILISWTASPAKEITHYEIHRRAWKKDDSVLPTTLGADWTRVKTIDAPPDRDETIVFEDEVDSDHTYVWAVRGLVVPELPVGTAFDPAALPAGTQLTRIAFAGPERPVAAWFDTHKAGILVIVLAMFVLLTILFERAKRGGKKMYVRRIPGIDAMEEAIGRSTEMGRPVLYIAGIDEIQNIQTVAGLLILGHVAEMVARYDTQIRVPCVYPLNMVVAEEIVRQGFYNAGRPDAHRPQNIQFISPEQFAFAAGVAGIMLREKPATNIYLGRFFAESLIFAETGYVNKAIQIGGTAEITQLPFFIAACDYTIIGEELFAVSAYLSREPRLLSALKATDYMKILILGFILVGAAVATFHGADLAGWVFP
jgi:hypothetical protein